MSEDRGSGAAKQRDLGKLVEALAETEAELDFQVHRLETMVKPTTESEVEYFGKMLQGYRTASRWVGILKRYQQGRIDRQVQEKAEGQTEDFPPRPMGVPLE